MIIAHFNLSTIAGKLGMISIDEARRFMVDCFLKSNTNQENAQAMADLLVEADYRGHFSHG